MRILFFVNGMHKGGKERRLVELLKRLHEGGLADVRLALMSREMAYPEVLDLGIRVHYLVRKSKRDPAIFRDLYRLCTEFRPDVIHTWDPMTTVYAGPVARLRGIRLVAGMITNAPAHLTRFSGARVQTRLGFLFADIVVANSQAGLRAYGAPAAKSVCIYNGFDMRRVRRVEDPRRVRERFDIRTKKVVGMSGEFADRKDFTSYIRAAEKVLAHCNDVTFLTIGSGDNEERCKALVNDSARGSIRFLGWQKDIDSIINILDVGVLATDAEIHGEGISNSILEYMAFGKPVVATLSGGTGEIVEDGVTGFLVGNRDVGALASHLEGLLSDEARARMMGEQGRSRAVEKFGMECMLEQYVSLYRRVSETS